MATITVSPVHFEDYSGIQFERLVFAYHLRAGWHDLIWHGQSGGDQGRDISGIEPFDDQPARKTIIQCANRDTLTLAKAKSDMSKSIKATGSVPDVFKLSHVVLSRMLTERASSKQQLPWASAM
ncbi:hypothetical protein V2154_07210 [Ewingella sp. CoE-038-23]|uniref:hypothetical protein n=1 Tax=Ewingella docleensis TaxID=3118588 RepID=UPI0033659EA2